MKSSPKGSFSKGSFSKGSFVSGNPKSWSKSEGLIVSLLSSCRTCSVISKWFSWKTELQKTIYRAATKELAEQKKKAIEELEKQNEEITSIATEKAEDKSAEGRY